MSEELRRILIAALVVILLILAVIAFGFLFVSIHKEVPIGGDSQKLQQQQQQKIEINLSEDRSENDLLEKIDILKKQVADLQNQLAKSSDNCDFSKIQNEKDELQKKIAALELEISDLKEKLIKKLPPEEIIRVIQDDKKINSLEKLLKQREDENADLLQQIAALQKQVADLQSQLDNSFSIGDFSKIKAEKLKLEKIITGLQKQIDFATKWIDSIKEKLPAPKIFQDISREKCITEVLRTAFPNAAPRDAGRGDDFKLTTKDELQKFINKCKAQGERFLVRESYIFWLIGQTKEQSSVWEQIPVGFTRTDSAYQDFIFIGIENNSPVVYAVDSAYTIRKVSNDNTVKYVILTN